MPQKPFDLTGIKPIRPMSEEEVGKAYLESMIMLPNILQALLDQMVVVSDALSVISLYAEKKGLNESLFTEDDLISDDDKNE